MASYDGSIRINTELLTSGFNKSLAGMGKSIKGSISGLNRSLAGIGRSITGSIGHMERGIASLKNSVSGLLGSLGLGLGIAGLVALGKQAIDTASDIQEVQNVVDTAFGSMSYKMEEFSKTAVKQFGISQLSAKQMGSTFMAMGASMVGSMEQASDMAINLTARAADMASFYNKSIEETSTALKSIYTGETESLKEYGVVMTQVNLQEFARQRGITKSIQAMTQAEKVELQYAYVMQQTSLAAGDFAKTSDSWANQTRILSEQFKELLSVLGSGLITALTPVVKFLNTILGQLIAMAKQIGSVLSKLFGISIPVADASKNIGGMAGSAGDLSDDMDSASDSAGNLADGVKKAKKEAKKALAPFDKLNVLSKDAASGKDKGSGNGASVSGLGGATQIPTIDMSETKETEGALSSIQENLGKIFDVFKQAWEEKGESVISAAKAALEGIKNVAKSVGRTFYEVFTNGTGAAWLESILEVLRSMLSLIGAIGNAFAEAWNSGSGLAFVTEIFEMFTAINNLIATISDTITTAFNNGTGTAWIQSVLDKFTAILGVVKTLSSTLQAAWEMGAGLAMIEAILTAMTNVNNLITTIADSFSRVWNNGTGVEIWTNILGIVEGVANIIGNLASQIQKAWDTAGVGDGIWQAVLDIINTILETIHNIVDSTAEWAGKLNFTPLLTSIKTLLEALEPLTENIGAGLEWFWNNVLLPIAGWVIQDAVPVFLDMLSTAIDTVNSVIDALKPLGNWLWEKFLQPLGNWAGKTVISAMEQISNLLKKVSGLIKAFADNVLPNVLPVIETFLNGVKTGIESTVDALGGIVDALGGVIDFLTGVFTGDWEKAWEGIKTFFSGIWTAIKSIVKVAINVVKTVISTGLSIIKSAWNVAWSAIKTIASNAWTGIKGVFSGIGGWFKTKFEGAYKKITNAFSGVSEFFEGVWSNIKGAFGNIVKWFRDNFSEAWEAVKKVFSAGGKVFTGIKDGILSGLKTVINALISGINKVIKIPFDGINAALQKIKDIKIVGKKPFGFLPTIDVPQIPQLANGAVIRGGDPFMAVLGDQPRGQTNIETPLPTMVKAFKQAMAETGGSGGDISVRVYIGEKDVTQMVKTEADMYFKRTGKPLFGY